MHILLVTPRLSDAELAGQRLQRSAPATRVDACALPEQARGRILTVRHDALVVDVMAFGESGLQLIAECRAHAPEQPILALTRGASGDDVAMASVAGATASIAKEAGWPERLVEALLGDVGAAPGAGNGGPGPVTVDAGPGTDVAADLVASPGGAFEGAPSRPVPPQEGPAPTLAAPVADQAPRIAAELPHQLDLAAQVDRLRHALDQESAIRRDAEARARNLASAHDADRQRWELALRHLEERYAALTQQQSQRSEVEAAFESVEQRYMALLEERRRDLRRLEVLDEQALRQREALGRLESERDRLAREAATARESAAQAEAERARVAEAASGSERRIAELELQLARATDDLRQAADHGSAIQAALARAERDQQDAHAELEGLRRRAESDATAIAERDARIASLEHALEAAANEARDARTELERQRAAAREEELTRELAAARNAAEEAASGHARTRGVLEDLLVERASLRDRLREANDARASAANLTAIGLATTSRDGRILRATDAFAQALGFESASAMLATRAGSRVAVVVDPQALARRLDESTAPVRVEARVRRPGGHPRWVSATALPPAGAAPAETIDWVAQDVSDTAQSRQLQRRIRRLDGACGLAVSAGARLLDGAPETSTLRQVVAFARHQAHVEVLNDLAERLSVLEPAVGRLLGGGIECRLHPVPAPLIVEIDPEDVEHVLAATALALREALPLGGTVDITVGSVDAEDTDAASFTLTPVARITFMAKAHGLRDVNVPTTVASRLADVGGRARAAFDPEAGARIEVDLPLVIDLGAGE